MKLLKGWRTRLFSFGVATLGFIEMLDPHLLSTAFGLGERSNAVLLVVIAVATYGLRQITTTPPGEKY